MKTEVKVKRTLPPTPPPPTEITISLDRDQATLLKNYLGFSKFEDVLANNSKYNERQQVKDLSQGEVSRFIYNLYSQLETALT